MIIQLLLVGSIFVLTGKLLLLTTQCTCRRKVISDNPSNPHKRPRLASITEPSDVQPIQVVVWVMFPPWLRQASFTMAIVVRLLVLSTFLQQHGDLTPLGM